MSRVIASEVLGGVGVGLCLLTAYRGSSGVGVGEVVLAISILLSLQKPSGSYGKGASDWGAYPGLGMLAVSLFVIMPSSLVFEIFSRHAYGRESTALRDLMAYALTGLVSLVFGLSGRQLTYFANSLLLTLGLVIFWQILAPGEAAYYGERFAAGAKNPNQLALYLVASPALLLNPALSQGVRIPLALGMVAVGLMTKSDALLAAWAGGIFLSGFARACPPQRFWLLPVIMLSAGLILSPWLNAWWSDFAEIWSSADQGQSRTTLIKYGLEAWLDNPWSILFGNGAGAFSGLAGPFEGEESHNGIVDLLSIAGVIGLVAVYSAPVAIGVVAYKRKKYTLLGVITSILVFNCFHYVLRQPIFLISLVAVGKEVSPAGRRAEGGSC